MMNISIELDARHLWGAVAVVAASVLAALWWASPARSAAAAAAPDPVEHFAFVARADDPVDALAASSVAGQLGAPVYLTFPASLDQQAADGLAATDPQVVVLAGGTAALSQQVEDEIAQLLPDARIRRLSGAGRTETARLVNELTGELGVARPVLAGATVTGDVGIQGQLTVAGTDVAATLAQMQDRLDSLEADNTALKNRVDSLESTLAGVSRTQVDGHDTLRFEAMNLQVVNGEDATHTTNGLGNLIVGYHEDHTTNDCVVRAGDDFCVYSGDGEPEDRTGSHNLIVGVDHTYSSFSGLLAGLNSTTSGIFASVSGGRGNTASQWFASVTGGNANTASAFFASVSGGTGNTASGQFGSVSGGTRNTASRHYASVSGGRGNTASADAASVSGGRDNEAADRFTTVAGGRDGTITDDGVFDASGNDFDSLIGNQDFPDE